MANDPHWNKVVLGLKCDGTNGSTTFTDSSLSAKTVTGNGNAQISTAQSKFGGASAYFDGVGDYLSLTGESFSTGDFTIEGWMYLTALSKTNPLFDSRTADNDTAGLAIYIRSATNKLTVGTGNPFVATEGTTTLTTGWHHVAVVKVGGNIKAYLNGNLELTVANASSLANTSWKIGNTWNANADGAIYIDDLRVTKGVARYTANFTPPATSFPTQLPVISGVVKDSSGNFAQRLVRVFDRKTGTFLNATLSDPTTGAYSLPVATADETMVVANDAISDPYWGNVVLAMHMDGANNSTTFVDEMGKTVTANGNAKISTAQSKFGGASAYFDGTGDYLSVASSGDFGFGTSDFTIECWVKTAWTNKSVWDNRTTSEAGTGYIATTTGRIGFWNNVAAFEGTTNVADDTWHHLAWCRASGTLRLFVDGVAEYTGVMTSDLGASRPLRVGRDYLNSGDFNGYIDDLRITKGVARYTANFTPPTAAFLGPLSGGTENAVILDRVVPV